MSRDGGGGPGSSRWFPLRLARWEARAAFGRVGVFAASIALGVGTLVAIHSFRGDVARSLEEQARTLMGADARISGDAPLPPRLDPILDSLRAAGTGTARVTTTVSMVLAPRSGRVRLLQVKAVEGPWPFYGAVSTEPLGRWSAHSRPGSALVDPAALVQLGAVVGDTLRIGETTVRIEGTVADLPTDLGFQAAVGPRVWISGDDLREAQLLGVGSLARYEAYLRYPGPDDAGVVWSRYADAFRGPAVDYTTAGEQARGLTDALDFLARYLGLVGLGALLLGAIGVAGAIHVYVRGRLTDVAVLRCVGARQRTVFLAYLLQAAGLGGVGSLLGVLLGVGVQHLLPGVMGDALPVSVEARFAAAPALGGLVVGLVVSVLFTLPPLLAVRDVPPLRALRRDVEPAARRLLDPLRLTTFALIAAAVTAMSVVQAGSVRDGLAFAAGLAGAVLVLLVTAAAVTRVARHGVPVRAPWVVRQGVSNLFRPRNQTVSVTLVLGFGVFVVGTVLQLEASLSGHLSLEEGGEGRPDLMLFDIQPDQLQGVLGLLPRDARTSASVSPVVPARIESIGGRSPEDLLADTTGRRPARWALQREYRNTYRWDLTGTEELVAGSWFDAARSVDGPVPVSLEEGVARDLRVELGDTVTWSVAGRPVESVVTSLRRVDWERFATNFFVVFRPGPLDAAPQMAVVLTRLPDPERRSAFQGSLVRSYPNVSALDLARVQEAVDALVGQVRRVIRFLAAFSAVAGLLVLAGALGSSRRERLGESALLRTLGARRAQVTRVLLAEYVALGAVATVTGLLLATVASWLLLRGVFDVPFAPSPWGFVAVWLGVTALTVAAGAAGSRGVTTRPPLPVLREVADQG